MHTSFCLKGLPNALLLYFCLNATKCFYRVIFAWEKAQPFSTPPLNDRRCCLHSFPNSNAKKRGRQVERLLHKFPFTVTQPYFQWQATSRNIQRPVQTPSASQREVYPAASPPQAQATFVKDSLASFLYELLKITSCRSNGNCNCNARQSEPAEKDRWIMGMCSNYMTQAVITRLCPRVLLVLNPFSASFLFERLPSKAVSCWKGSFFSRTWMSELFGVSAINGCSHWQLEFQAESEAISLQMHLLFTTVNVTVGLWLCFAAQTAASCTVFCFQIFLAKETELQCLSLPPHKQDDLTDRKSKVLMGEHHYLPCHTEGYPIIPTEGI